MNKVILMGRLTRDPEVRYGSGENSTAVARYTIAVDRRFKRDGDQNNYSRPASNPTDADGFMNIPDGIDDELPFS